MKSRDNNCLYRYVAALALMLSVLFPVAEAQQIEGDPNPLGMYSVREHPPTYQPGTGFSIKVTLSAQQQGVINAVGLRETIPPGWEFAGIRGVSGGPPAVTPQPGQQGLLEFAWISIPELPYQFVYDVNIPQDSRGDKFLHGALEYRMDGGTLVAPPIITQVSGPADSPPKLTLNPPNPMTVQTGTPFVEPGYTATDDLDGDISGRVQVSGSVDTTVAGTYSLSYSVTDSGGNAAPAQQRTVQVVGDSTTDGGTANGGTTGGGTTGGNVGNLGGRNYGGNTGNPRRYGTDNKQAASGAAAQTRPASPARSQAANLANAQEVPIDVRARLEQARAEAEKNGLTLPKRMTGAGSPNPQQPGVAGAAGEPTNGLVAATENSANTDVMDDAWPEEAPRQQLARLEGSNGGVFSNDSESVGVWGGLRQNVSDLGTGGLIALGVGLVAALGLIVAALYVGKMAYKPHPRKRRPAP